MNKLTLLKFTSVVIISIQLLGFLQNLNGILIYAVICGYYVFSTFVNDNLIQKKPLIKTFESRIVSQVVIFTTITCSSVFFLYFCNVDIYALFSERLFFYITYLIQFVYVTPFAVFMSVGFFYFVSYLIFYITIKKVKSLTLMYIFIGIMTIVSLLAGYLYSEQYLLYIPIIAGTLTAMVLNTNIVSTGLQILSKIKAPIIFVIYLLLLITLLFISNMYIATLVITILIIISHTNEKVLNLNQLEFFNKYYFLIVPIMYMITYNVIRIFNLTRQNFIIILCVSALVIVVTVSIYYILYISVLRNYKFRYVVYLFIFGFTIFTYTFTLNVENPDSKRYVYKTVDEYFLATQNVDVLISNAHDTYLIRTSNAELAGTPSLYISDVDNDNFKASLEQYYPNLTSDINTSYSLDDTQQLIEKYKSQYSDDYYVIVDLDSSKYEYENITQYCTQFETGNVFFVTNIGQEQTNVLYQRAALEYDNCHVIDFAKESEDKPEYYYTNEYELNNIGLEAYENFVYNEITRIMRDE